MVRILTLHEEEENDVLQGIGPVNETLEPEESTETSRPHSIRIERAGPEGVSGFVAGPSPINRSQLNDYWSPSVSLWSRSYRYETLRGRRMVPPGTDPTRVDSSFETTPLGNRSRLIRHSME